MTIMRNQDTTKHDYGHALLIAGSYGRMGCAILAAKAALRSGCGLVSVHLPERCVNPMQTNFPEAMVSIDPSPTLFSTLPDHLDYYTAIAVGPGIGTDPTTAEALLRLLEHHQLSTSHYPLILDADALNILSLYPDWLPLAKGAIITPHEREYARLFADADPAEMANRHHLIIVKKSHRTCIFAPDGHIYENHSGNAGMATAGSGDVLTGILLGMICSNHLHASLFDIVCKAVEIHGRIGDLAIEKQSESSLIASDMIENLKKVSTDITVS